MPYEPPEITNEITIGPAEGKKCFTAECVAKNADADVTITYGYFSNRMFWRDSQGRTYHVCNKHADAVIKVVREHHPEITITPAFGDVIQRHT